MYLNCHSYYSLRYGTIPIDELVTAAKSLGVSAMALTDTNCSTGIYDFIKKCKQEDIKPIVGIEFHDESMLYIGIAKNREGFKEMNELLTICNAHKQSLPIRPQFNNVFVIYPFGAAPSDLRDNEFIGVRINEVNKLLSQKNFDKYVILHPVTFCNAKQYELHNLLRCVDNNIILTRLAENQKCQPNEYMISVDKLTSYYKQYPQIISNTEKILSECSFDFEFKTLKNKKHYTGSKHSDRLLLESLAVEGMKKRYSNNKEAERRIKKEIEVIDNLGFACYFLTTWDIIRYSKSRGFFHVGRGSGANSIVSYCLEITDICPIELNLYFERFLNPSRTSPPDFDIDWSWKDRDEILAYIFKRFDTRCTAFVGTVSEFKYRSTIRELGKVYGLPKNELDDLTDTRAEHHDKNDSIVSKIHYYGNMLEKFPNMRSVHSCGVVIAEEPLTYYTALDMPPKGLPTTQFDMYIMEEIGFEKLDILSQRGIGHINDSVKLVEKNQGIKIDIHKVNEFKRNPDLNQKLSEGKTLGCFYVESPAMRGLLRRLKCNTYEILVAASSVIRPGVAKSGMLREYIFRHNNPTKFQYFHKVFEEQLGETYGIMIYQEDVIKIAHHFAGLELSDGDILRRAMSGKTRSKAELEKVKERFFNNCKQKGYTDELSNEVYRQIESFAGYSFCKAHSASYAVESYQSLYLKTYYPIEFMVAVINNFGGFYRTEVYIHEARMAGANIHQPCINNSEYHTSVKGKDIYLGFIHLENLESRIGEGIPLERERHGDYLSLEDFIKRIPIGIEMLQILIFCGSFRFTGKAKSELILDARLLMSSVKNIKRETLFYEPVKSYTLPKLERTKYEDAFDELELFGFPISCSVFDLLHTKFRGDIQVKDMLQNENKVIRMVGYMICRKNVPTVKGLMNFGTWIDSNGEYFDSTHFPDQLKRYPFKGGGCYLMLGKITVDFNFPTIEVIKMAKLPMVSDPRYSDDEKKIQIQVPKTSDNHPYIPMRNPYPSKEEVSKMFRHGEKSVQPTIDT